MKNQDYLYLDHAASTPMRKSAMDKYIEAESFGFANSSGGHKLSRNSKNLLEDSREVFLNYSILLLVKSYLQVVELKQTTGRLSHYLIQKLQIVILLLQI